MITAIQGSLFDVQTVLDYGQSIVSAGQELAKYLFNNQTITTRAIQSQMNRHFHGTAAEGKWLWKDAYEAVEVALILYLRQNPLAENPLYQFNMKLHIIREKQTRKWI